MNAGDCPPVGMESCGNPISVALGDKIEKVADYTSGGQNPLTLTRYYNSWVSAPRGSFGNWRWTYDRSISVSSSEVDLYRPDGKTIDFFPNGSGGWEGVTDLDLRVTQVNSTTWTVTDWEDNVETYTPVGGSPTLTSIKTRNGYTQTFAYATTSFGSNQLTSVADSYGRKLTVAWGGNGLISSVTTPDGLVLSYTYSNQSGFTFLLTQVGYPSSPKTSRTYLYEDTHFEDVSSMPLTGVVDENGSWFATWAYDDSFIYPIAISSQHAGGADLTTLAFSNPGEPGTVTVTNALGLQEVYDFESFQASVDAANEQYVNLNTEIDRQATSKTAAAVSKTKYDSNGFVASRTDWNGNVTTYTNDSRGDVTSQTLGSGTSLAQTTTTVWHPKYHLPTKITQPSRTVSFTYDADGNRLTETIAASSGTSAWTYTYNATGEVLTKTDPRGNVTTYTYDAHGNLASLANALGQVTSITSYDANGRPLSIKDPNGLVTDLTYNFRGQVTSRTQTPWVTTYGYDAVGQLIKLTRPDSSYLTFSYDAAHRFVGVADALGRNIAYTLDAAGDVIEEQVFASANKVVRTHSYTYDAVSRLLQSIGAQAQTTKFAYDDNGNATQYTDPVGDVTSDAFDAINREIQSTDPSGRVTGFAYDLTSRLTEVTDPRGLATSYAYSRLDKPTSIVSQDSGQITKTYDAAGNVLSSADARGNTTKYTYDALNRLTRAAFADGSATTYAYDQGANGIGHLTSMTDSTGKTAWTYEIHGLITAETQTNGAAKLTTRSTYDKFGRLSTLTYPSGAVFDFAYNSNGQTSSLSYRAVGAKTATALIAQISYQPFGPVNRWLMGSGAVYSRTFDQDGRIASIGLPAGGAVSIKYDAASRIKSIAEQGLATKTFGYGAVSRLTSYVDGANSEDFDYDANGNRTAAISVTGSTKVSEAYSYDTKSNRLLKIAGSVSETVLKLASSVNETFGYDASGDTTSDATAASDFNYAYDAKGRLATSKNGSQSLAYGINGLGQRTSKSNTSTTSASVAAASDPPQTYFVYDQAGHLVGEYNSAGVAREETVWLGDLPVATIQSGAVYYIAPDHLGAPHQITDASKAVVWFWDHDPFGNGAPTGSLNYSLRLPGQFYDAITGLYYNGFRDYDPATGRYIESDPIGLSAGINTYAYVDGNPLGLTDPLGLDPAPSGKFAIHPEILSYRPPGAPATSPSPTSAPSGPRLVIQNLVDEEELAGACGGDPNEAFLGLNPSLSPNPPTNLDVSGVNFAAH